MKKYLLTLILLVASATTPTTLFAEERICVQNYGQPVVCGVTHDVVKYQTGIADINFKVVATGFLLLSGAFFVISKKQSVL